MNHVQIFLWWWWADINGTLGSVDLEAQGFVTNLTLITTVYSLRLRWPMCSPYYTSPFFLNLILGTCYMVVYVRWKFLLEPNHSSIVCKVFDAVFLHKASWLWFGCHSFVRVRSMSVAPSCLPPPLPPGYYWMNRVGAWLWPGHVPPRLHFIDQPTTLSASLVLVLCLNCYIGTVSGRTKSLFTFWFPSRWMLYPLVSTHGLFWRILRLSHGANWIIAM